MIPELFVNRMQEMLGVDYEAFSAGFGEGRYHALRLNGLKKNK